MVKVPAVVGGAVAGTISVFVMLSTAVPVFVSTTVGHTAVFVPCVSGHAIGDGVNVIVGVPPTPFPFTCMKWGLPAALSVTTRVAAYAPSMTGAKVTGI